MRAARLAQVAPRRGAFGASLALHGALAGAAVLPFLAPPPILPSAPTTLELVWAPVPAAGMEEAALDPLPEAEPLAAETGAELVAAELAPPEPPAEAMPDQPAPPIAEAEPEPPPLTAPAPLPPVAEAVPEPPPPPIAEMTADPPPQPAETLPPPPEAPQRPRQAPPRSRPPAAPARGNATPPPAGIAAPSQPVAMTAAPPPGPILITAPRYRRPPAPPRYPPRAVELGLTGTVLLRARVGPEGGTEEIRVWRSSGQPLLDAAAMTAVRGWDFEPASVDGRRVEAWVEVPVHFRLH